MEGNDFGALHPWQEAGAFIWLVTYKIAQVLLETSIEDFGLAIRLWMIGATRREGGALEFEELLPKIA